MRSVLSISISPVAVRRIKKRAKAKGMTVSAYLVRLADVEETMISEEELMEDIRQGEEDRRQGKGTILRSDEDVATFFKKLR